MWQQTSQNGASPIISERCALMTLTAAVDSNTTADESEAWPLLPLTLRADDRAIAVVGPSPLTVADMGPESDLSDIEGEWSSAGASSSSGGTWVRSVRPRYSSPNTRKT